MYKHHSYNKLIEKKLEQLPGPDTASLWSGMEAMLDQHMPQKKRRPGVLGWLCANKAWMLVALSAVSVTGLSLVYFAAPRSQAAPQAPLSSTTAPAPQPAAASSASEAVADAPQATAPLAAASASSTATKTNNTLINTAAATTAAAAAAQRQSSASASSSNHTTSTNHHIAPVASKGDKGTAPTAASSSADRQVLSADKASADAATDNSQVLHWATTATAVAQPEKAAPSLSGVNVNKETLEQLSQKIAAQKMGRLPEEKGFYAGVVAGLDMSTVKFQSLQTGRNQGLLVGYAFNNRWSVESGLQWDKKKYYSSGEYYKADGYTTQPGMTDLNIDGSCLMYELPVNVRYNILTGQSKLFVTAGVSSYLMKKEVYGLKYKWNGDPFEEYHTYNNVSKNWASVANFSVGYSQKLGGFGSLRVEPYLRLPFRDLGVGKMRVTSMGLNVGFTKTLKRY